MTAKDVYHQALTSAPINVGWVITRDPYTLTFGQKDVWLDSGAERTFAAELLRMVGEETER